ncbi:hypothetical protein SGRIM128S_03797 [Streptomyces griseomycini]
MRSWTRRAWRAVSTRRLAAELGVSGPSTALAFTTWAYALARTTASRMGATTYAVPALVVLMSWLALGEVPGPLTLVGGVLCLAGVAVSRSRSRAGTGPGAAPASRQETGEPRAGRTSGPA